MPTTGKTIREGAEERQTKSRGKIELKVRERDELKLCSFQLSLSLALSYSVPRVWSLPFILPSNAFIVKKELGIFFVASGASLFFSSIKSSGFFGERRGDLEKFVSLSLGN